MSFVDFAELKKSTSIVEVLKWLEISNLKEAPNGQFRGCCPIHQGTGEREFVVTPSKNLYFCFAGCGGGDIIKLVANYRKIGTKEAAQAIAETFGKGTVPGKGTVTSPRNSTVSGNSTSPAEPPEFRVLEYLEPSHEALQALGVSEDTARAFGAGYAPKGILRGRMAIPIHTRTGKLIAYCGRAVKGESPALLFPNGFQPQSVIYNAHRLTEGELYLVRDPLQVLTAYESGIENVVAFLTEGIAAVQFEMLASLMDEKRCESAVLF